MSLIEKVKFILTTGKQANYTELKANLKVLHEIY